MIGEVYRHKKGGLYRVVARARHTETEEDLVIYEDITVGSGSRGLVWARPAWMFMEPDRFENVRGS